MDQAPTKAPLRPASRRLRGALPDSAPDVIARYLSRQRREFLRCGKAVRQNGGADSLHDLRVASRRLRAALRLLPSETASKLQNRVRKSLRRLGRVLGGPRESDVNVAILEQRRSAAEASLGLAVELLLGLEHERQARLRAKMQRQLRKIDLDEIGRRLSPSPGRRSEGRWLLPLDRFAAQHIEPAQRSLERLWDRASVRPSEQSLHAVRIAIKKLRYMLEILSPALVARRRASTLSRLRSLQDALGELNDLTVLHREIAGRRRSFERLELSSLAAALRSVERSLSKDIRARRGAVVIRLRGERRFVEDLSSGLLR